MQIPIQKYNVKLTQPFFYQISLNDNIPDLSTLAICSAYAMIIYLKYLKKQFMYLLIFIIITTVLIIVKCR